MSLFENVERLLYMHELEPPETGESVALRNAAAVLQFVQLRGLFDDFNQFKLTLNGTLNNSVFVEPNTAMSFQETINTLHEMMRGENLAEEALAVMFNAVSAFYFVSSLNLFSDFEKFRAAFCRPLDAVEQALLDELDPVLRSGKELTQEERKKVQTLLDHTTKVNGYMDMFKQRNK